jgi:hypothetical protein
MNSVAGAAQLRTDGGEVERDPATGEQTIHGDVDSSAELRSPQEKSNMSRRSSLMLDGRRQTEAVWIGKQHLCKMKRLL